MEYEVRRIRRVLSAEEVDAYKGEPVGDLEPTVDEAVVYVDDETGEPVAAYLPIADAALLRKAVHGVPMTGVQRSTAFRSQSRTFGAVPRKPTMRRDDCRLSALAAAAPERHKVLELFATQLGATLREIAPAVVEADLLTLGVVDPGWRMGEDRLWTSGIINRSAQLPYHRDAFNFRTWSAMPVVRRGMRGGYLSVPEYGLVFPCRDGWCVYFCGRELMHGVTPMRPTGKDSYRYSVVYYALRGMKDCFTYAAELEYGRQQRTIREREMAKRLAAGDTSIPGGKKRKQPAVEELS